MNHVIDASVVLAVMLGEQGAQEAFSHLEGSIISTVNLSEIYRKLIDGEAELTDAIIEVGRFQMRAVPFDEAQAREAARLRPLTRHLGLSLADRACVGLASIRNLAVLTADRRMAESGTVLGLDIRMIR